MTYCLGISLNDALVFTSDSRTNAGVDQISVYSKLRTYGIPDQRQLVLLSSGNLATTQAVAAQLERDIELAAPENLLTVTDLHAAADYLGRTSLTQQNKMGGGPMYEANFILGGQIGKNLPTIIMLYPQGNYITTSPTTPFLQIGESKYGKPLLDSLITSAHGPEAAAQCAMLAMAVTMRSNAGVGPPIDIMIYRKDSLRLGEWMQFTEDSDYLRELKQSWDRVIRQTFQQLPPLPWQPHAQVKP